MCSVGTAPARSIRFRVALQCNKRVQIQVRRGLGFRVQGGFRVQHLRSQHSLVKQLVKRRRHSHPPIGSTTLGNYFPLHRNPQSSLHPCQKATGIAGPN